MLHLHRVGFHAGPVCSYLLQKLNTKPTLYNVLERLPLLKENVNEASHNINEASHYHSPMSTTFLWLNYKLGA